MNSIEEDPAPSSNTMNSNMYKVNDGNISVTTTVAEALPVCTEPKSNHVSHSSLRETASAMHRQPFSDLSIGADPMVAATNDPEIMIERIVAILEYRLEKIVGARNGVSVIIKKKVQRDLFDYVSKIETLYNKVHYHSFEHASHVTISANKLVEMLSQRNCLEDEPLSHFALVFGALIHDVGHKGVPNFVLTKQKDDLSIRYNNKSIAERNSLDIGLSLLKEPRYDELRSVLFRTDADEIQFRAVLYSTILSTDVSSPEMVGRVVKRWEAIFTHTDNGEDINNDVHAHMQDKLDFNDAKVHENVDLERVCPYQSLSNQECLRKCVVMEHLIQVADVAHNFQDWELFIKWNFRLLKELYAVYLANLMPNVCPNWSKGQISFFDGYVLPLAKRLDHCKVLDENGGSFYEKAERNRDHWLQVGNEVSSIMTQGILENEDEGDVLYKILQIDKN